MHICDYRQGEGRFSLNYIMKVPVRYRDDTMVFLKNNLSQ